MRADILDFFALHRAIFGVCPRCEQLFRLSDCHLKTKGRAASDWMDAIERDEERLDNLETRIQDDEDAIRQLARERGRRAANRRIKLLDPVFAPNRLAADDAKVVFHPIDFIVFDGINSRTSMKRVVLLDRQSDDAMRRKLQVSIEKVIANDRYEWLVLRVRDDGTVCED